MLWKCCTQYGSKFGKLSSGHKTGEFSFHSNPKERLLGASVRNSAHGKGHEQGGLAYAKAWSSLRKPPVPSRASNPKTIVCFMLSPTPLTLRGALPHNHFSRRRNKRAAPRQLKFLGVTRVFQLTDSSEGHLAHLYRFIRPHVIVYSLPTWEARDVLDLLKANSFGELEIISIVG